MAYEEIKKRVVFICIAVVMMCSILIPNIKLSAASTTKVLAVEKYYEEIGDNQLLIPVNISDNNGIMGFRLEFIYDREQLEIDSISKGNVTQSGAFDSVIEDSGDFGRGSIVWYHTENVQMDGTVCYLSITLKGNYSSRVIRLGYIQEDTFNESWEDVVLDCFNIEIEQGNEIDAAENNNGTDSKNESNINKTEEEKNTSLSEGVEEKNSNPTEKENASDTDAEGVNAHKSIYEIEWKDLEKKDFNNDSSSMVNSNSGIITLSTKKPPKSELGKIEIVMNSEEEKQIKKETKKTVLSQSLPDKINNEEIKKYIVNELSESGYKRIEEIPETEVSDFWEKVKIKFISDNKELEQELKDSDFSVFADSISISEEEINEKEENNNIFIFLIVILFIFASLSIFVLIRKRLEK